MARHYARKVDLNHAQIRTELRQAGLMVVDTSRLGGGVPDLVVFDSRNARARWVEIKSKGGKLTPDELVFFEEWGDLVMMAYSTEDVLRAFGMLD